ncbi:uncharacterized protein METZ01_LOCUS432202 [marine metagenome]|uniref:Uncharacterized protein n=1 Tax=marine metagenome TaxID=408172 RepID=A0A382YA25_9ZZZZ
MKKIRYKATNLVELIRGGTRTVECPLCDGFFTFQLGDAEEMKTVSCNHGHEIQLRPDREFLNFRRSQRRNGWGAH